MSGGFFILCNFIPTFAQDNSSVQCREHKISQRRKRYERLSAFCGEPASRFIVNAQLE